MIVQNKKTLASILFVLISFVCSAQIDAPPPPQSGPPVPVGLPIDNGVVILFVIAILYGVYRNIKFSRD